VKHTGSIPTSSWSIHESNASIVNIFECRFFTDSVIAFSEPGGHCSNSVGGRSIDKLKLVGQQQRLRQEFPPGKLIRQRSAKLTGH